MSIHDRYSLLLGKLFKIDKEYELTFSSYILGFLIVNQRSNDIFSEWFSFSDEEKLLCFIK